MDLITKNNNIKSRLIPISTVIPSILVGGGLMIAAPVTTSAHNLVELSDNANVILCQNTVNSKYCELMKKIESYQYLKKNWDGYDGIAPKKEVISFANGIIQVLQKYKISAPKAMVSGQGEIGLFWKGQNDYIEISLEEDFSSSYFVKNDNEVYGEEDCFAEYKLPDKLLKALVARSTQNTMSVIDRQSILISEVKTTSSPSFLTI